jgi:acyl-CoA thioester hydrolase
VSEPTFRFHHPVEVRFKDIDVGGHAHHSQALVYFEEARTAYWREVVGRGSVDEIDYVLVEAGVRYHKRILWPQTLDVGVRVSRIGGKHFVMEFLVLSGEGERLVSGHTVQIMYDYDVASTTRIPEGVRASIEAWDGPFGAADEGS